MRSFSRLTVTGAIALSSLFVTGIAQAQVGPGLPDTAFGGGNARVRTNFNSKVLTDSESNDVAMQVLRPNNNAAVNANFGKMVVVGTNNDNSRPTFAMIRLNPNGTRDMGFGVNPQLSGTDANNTDGVIKEFFGSWDAMTNTVIQPDGKILTLGNIIKYPADGGGEDWRLVRYNPNGDRDTSFGVGGVVVFNTPLTGANRSKDITLDAQGRIYCVGYGNTQSSGQAEMYLYRLTATGQFDSTFGTGGRVQVNLQGTSQDQIWGVRVQSTGRVVCAGRSGNPIILGFTSAGVLDTTFGTPNNQGQRPGYTLLNTGVSSDYFRGMDIDRSDRIIAVGKYSASLGNNSTNRGIIARFNADGTLDTTFSAGDGTNGWYQQLAGEQSFYEDVEVVPAILQNGQVDPDTTHDKYAVGGFVDVVWGSDRWMAAFRHNFNGASDPTFKWREGGGTSYDGTAMIDAAPGFTSESGRAVTVDQNGQMIVPGDGSIQTAGNNYTHIIVARFNGTNGSIDTSFNTNGQVLTSLINKPGIFATRLTGGSPDLSYDSVIQSDNKIVQVGTTWNGWDWDFAVSRLATAGNLDLTFGDDDPDYADPARRTGKIIKDTGNAGVPDNNEIAYASASQSDGKIVVAGTVQVNGGAVQTTLFRVKADGSIDLAFGASGFRTNDFSGGRGDRPRRVVVDSSDRIYLVGDVPDGAGGSNLLLARYSSAGALDFSNTFNDATFEEGHSIALQPDGKVVIAGRGAQINGAPFRMYVGRFNVGASSFTIDNTFSLGRIYNPLTGTIDADAAYQGLFLIPHETRATPTAGTPNPTGTNQSEFDEGESVVVGADGTITIGGRTAPLRFLQNNVNVFPRPRYAMVRLTASGWLDTTFGTNGWVSTYMDTVAEDQNHDGVMFTLRAQNDGKLVGMGMAGKTIDGDIAAARYNYDNGTLDTLTNGSTSFAGTNGYITWPVGGGDDLGYSGAIGPDAKIVIAGFDGIREDFIAVRLQGDAAVTGTQTNAPVLAPASDSTRANWPGGSDKITKDNSPTFTGSPCVGGESVILKILNQTSSVEHTYKARHLCRASSANVYAATVPSFQASGGGLVGVLPDGTYKVAAYSATGASSTAVSAFVTDIVIDTVALTPSLTAPAANDKKDTEQTITFAGGGAELNAEVTVWDTTSVVWNATTGLITSGVPVKICSGLAAANGTWTCAVNPLALSLGLHKVKVQQEDIAANLSAMCVRLPATATCTADVSFFVKANTTTAVVSSVNPSVYGQPFDLTTRVRSNVGTPSGTVSVTYDGTLRTPPDTLNASADFKLSPPMPQSVNTPQNPAHTLTASFIETDKYFASQTAAAFQQVVNKADTAASVAISASPSVWGQPVTFTPTVAAVAPGAGTPTGSWTMSLDGAAAQALTPANLTAVLTTAALSVTLDPATPHSLNFTYSGDGNFNGSNKIVTQIVNKAATTTAVASSANPSTFDGSVTFTATVSITSPGAGTPSGTVTFRDGATVLGTGAVSLVNSLFKATYTTTALIGGTHGVTATYDGDGNFLTSLSSVVNQVVNTKATTTALVSSANPSTSQDSVTFTATVNDPRVTGDVEFYDNGATLLGSSTPASGVATYVTSALTPGTHPITAKFKGDGNFTTSTSPAVSQVVKTIPTTTTLTVSADNQPFGTDLTLTATVNQTAVSGTVTFYDGATSIGTSPVAGGVATLNTATLGAGSHSLKAMYSGDAIYDPSTSAVVTQTVAKVTTQVSVGSSLNPSFFGASVTFTATMSPAATPGSVTFMDGLTTLGSGNITGGVATFSSSALAVGSHSITAVYAATANYDTSTSSALSQTVDRAPSVTSVQSSLNPAIVGNSITFTATVTTGATGTITFKDGGSTLGTGTVAGNTATFTTSTLLAGSHSIGAEYSGDGNYLPSSAAALTQDVNKAATTVGLASATNPSVFGTSVTFTATVTAGATGTVTFADGGTDLGTGTLSGTTATFTTAALTGGTHSFTASYAGDANYQSSSSTPLTQTVNRAATTTTVVSSSNPATYGSSITFTATVSIGALTTPATGTVTFKDGVTTLGSAPVNAGTATFSTSALGAGSHNITAEYSGDTNYAVSASSVLAQSVTQAVAAMTLGSSINPSTFTAPVTFTATLPSDATGTVTFNDGGSLLGTGTLTSGVATFTTSALSVATHTITAVFAGDANYSGKTSDPLLQVVDKAATTTVVSSSQPVTAFNGTVTFTATVTNGATGTVTFKDGAVTLGTGTLTGTTATFTTTTLVAGTHAITAEYGGDGNYLTSVSAPVTQTVNRAATSVGLASSANPSTYGSAVTFSATVTTGASGTVTFTEGATTLGTGTLSGTTATFTTSALNGGAHTITASYGGDANYDVSTSSILAQTVDRAASTTAVVSSANPSTFGDAVTYTATVTPGATGTITFKNGAATLGTAAVNAGTAAFTNSTLSAGSHGITAEYAGDTNFLPSVSSSVAQTVNQATPSMTLTSSVNPSTFGVAVTFTAALPATATGSVTFNDGATALGTGVLSSGVATFTTNALGVDTHNITGVFAGDSNYLTKTSDPVAQVVNKASTTTTLASSLPTSTFGDPVTFTATVTAGATGTVTFMEGATTLGTSPLVGASATFSTSALTGGTHLITAIYSGEANYSPSTSPVATQTVQRASTTTSLSASANPSTFGNSITLTATVTNGATGTVTFRDGATVLGTGTVSANTATLQTAALVGGPHSLTASYDGDTNFAPSSSSNLAQTVDKAPATAAVASSANPSTFGSAVAFTATVTPGATGTVTFRDGASVLSTVALSGNTATLSTSSFAAGAHAITATYDGDGNYLTAVSATLNQTIDKAATPVALTSSTNPSMFTGTVTFTATVPNGATGSVTFREGATSLGSAALSAGVATLTTSTLATGSHPIVADYAGDANYLGSSSSALSQVVDRAVTTTAVVSSVNPSVFGSAVTITATVTNGASGSVTFLDGLSPLGTVNLAGNTAALTTSALTGGTHNVTATYAGDANYAPSASTAIAQVVDRATPVLNFSTSATPSTFGGSVTLTAKITAGTGSITFSDGATTLGTVSLASGEAALTTSALTAGTHTITAGYSGDANYLPITSNVSQTVNQAATSVAVASSTNPSVYGNSIVFTATVTSAAAGMTGTVTFLDGVTALGTAPLAGTTATFAASGLGAGAHAITASYNGDTNFTTSVSAAVAQTIDKAVPAIALTSSPNPSRLGAGVTFSATLPAAVTGTITFADGATSLGTATLVGGTATVTTTTLIAGARSITASYNGDANYAAAAATPLSHRVFGPASMTASTPLTRSAGGSASISQIAVVSHEADAAGALVVTATSVPADVIVTSVQNANGTVSASVAAVCGAAAGPRTVVLQVVDLGGLTTTANLTVNVTADTPPALGTYAAVRVAANGSGSAMPLTAPSDNGSIASIVVTPPSTFTGTALVDPVTAGVTYTRVNPGAHSFTITATDNCSQTTSQTLVVQGNQVPLGQSFTVNTTEETPVSITVGGSDSDGDKLTFTIGQQPTHGALSGSLPVVVYTPAPGFDGTDAFSYVVSDRFNNSSPATVTINVSALPPSATGLTPNTGVPVGGQTIMITGTHLDRVTGVHFGGVAAQIVAVSPGAIRIVVPAHAAGSVDVTLTWSGGTIIIAGGFTYDPNAQRDESVFPVVGSTRGAFGSFFRTAIQMFNNTGSSFEGLLVFYPQGGEGGASTKTMPIKLAAGETLYIPDLLPALGATGVGSANLQVVSGTLPVIVTRVYNDAGETGTSGMIMQTVRSKDVLLRGDTAALITPSSTERFRFNIGVRALADGATVDIAVRDSSGVVRETVTRSFAPNSFLQTAADALTGGAWSANQTISFSVTQGSAVIYGATTDNTTQDPSVQQAQRISLAPRGDAIISVVGSTAGAFGSFFRTAMQFYNPSSSPMSGRLVFHAAGQSGTSSDPALALELKAGEVRSIDDFLPALGLSGLGSVDVEVVTGSMPVSVLRIFNDGGEKGTSGMTIDAVSRTDALQAGDSGSLIAPPAAEGFRFSIGIRTLDHGVSMLVTQRDQQGNTVSVLERSFAPSSFQQTSAAALLGHAIGANDTLTFSVTSGAAVVYGSTTDNLTQDPSYQLAARNR